MSRALRFWPSLLLATACSVFQAGDDNGDADGTGYREAPVLSSSGFRAVPLGVSSLKKLPTGRHRVSFRFPDIVFGQVGGSADSLEDDFDGKYNEFPTLLVKDGRFGGWRTVNLKKDFLHYRWTHVFTDPPSQRYWGLLEYTVEGPGSDVPVIYSEDDGKTWYQISAVPKPHHMATARDFRMSSDGKGYVELELDHGILVDPKGRRGAVRRYRATTADWGKTWRLNLDKFDVDVLQPAQIREESDCSNLVANWWKEPQPKECELPKELRKYEPK